MFRRGVVAALLKAVRYRSKANRVTVETIGNAVLHRGHGILLLTGENEALAAKFPWTTDDAWNFVRFVVFKRLA